MVRLTADRPGKLNFKVGYVSPLDHKVSRKGKKLVLTGKGRDHEGVKGLIRMETQTQAAVDGGKVKIDDQNITVEGADSVTPVSYTHLDVYKRQGVRRYLITREQSIYMRNMAMLVIRSIQVFQPFL